MLTNENTRPRVSIAERLVPALALGVAATAGAVGAWRMIAFFQALRHNENAGMAAFFTGVAQIEGIVGGLLAFGAVLGFGGLAVAVVRMFLTTRTASPSPWLMAGMGILGLFPPVVVGGCIGVMLDALKSPAQSGLSETGATAATLFIITIGSALVALPVLLVLSLVPFRGPAVDSGGRMRLSEEVHSAQQRDIPKRPATLIVIILVQIAIVSLTVWYFTEMFASRAAS